MRKDEANFVSITFQFPGLEGKNLEHNVPLVGDRILKVRKFQNSVKLASEQEEFSIG